MADTTDFQEQALRRAEPKVREAAATRFWEKFKQVVIRSIFWSYERGTWQYDLMVLAILAFIFLSRPSWFRDRPTLQLTDIRHNQGIVEETHTKKERTYLVDARLVESLASAKPQDALQQILSRHLQRNFAIKSWQPVTGQNGVILSYRVVVTP